MGTADEEGRYVAVRGVRGWRGGRDGYGVGTEGTAVLRGWVWWQGVRGVDGGDGGADQRHHHRDRHHLPPHPLVDLVRRCEREGERARQRGSLSLQVAIYPLVDLGRLCAAAGSWRLAGGPTGVFESLSCGGVVEALSL